MGVIRQSEAEWKGDLESGTGLLKLGSKAYTGPYSFKSRTAENSPETNPEELIAAAHAGCFSMQLAAMLSKGGYVPDSIHSTAKVFFGPDGDGFAISKIALSTEVKVSGLSENDFMKIAEHAKSLCPVSKALSAVKIEFNAKLISYTGSPT
jgi:osmotically inducible protein OsmC